MPKQSRPVCEYQHPAVAVDLALMTVMQSCLHVLLVSRDDADLVGGQWALPGAFVHVDKSLDQTVVKVLQEKARVSDVYLEQLGTFGALDRDPRGRVISITYFALVPWQILHKAVEHESDSLLASIDVPRAGERQGEGQREGEAGRAVHATDGEKRVLSLAFDHAEILGQVVKRLRGKLDYSGIGLELLPHRFTLRDVQEVHEAILGKPLTKPAFRRKVLDRGLIRPTGERETASAFRPAELYERIQDTNSNEKD